MSDGMNDRTRELECVISDLKQQVRDAEKVRDDLLEALQELCEIVEDAIEQKSAKDLDSFTLQPARAAIAKATGDQL